MHCDVEAHWGGCGLRLIYNFTWLDGVGGKGCDVTCSQERWERCVWFPERGCEAYHRAIDRPAKGVPSVGAGRRYMRTVLYI